FVRADKHTEAGVLPSNELVAAIGRFNEEMVKAGVLLAGEGYPAQLEGGARHLLAGRARGERWAIPRQGAGRGLLDDPGEVETRRDRVGQARAVQGWRSRRGSPGLRGLRLPARGPVARGRRTRGSDA